MGGFGVAPSPAGTDMQEGDLPLIFAIAIDS